VPGSCPAPRPLRPDSHPRVLGSCSRSTATRSAHKQPGMRRNRGRHSRLLHIDARREPQATIGLDQGPSHGNLATKRGRSAPCRPDLVRRSSRTPRLSVVEARWYHADRPRRFLRRPFVPHSSRGPGHRPLKAEITGSNPVCGTKSRHARPDLSSDRAPSLPAEPCCQRQGPRGRRQALARQLRTGPRRTPGDRRLDQDRALA
jgi:hypothetical protein